MYSDLTLYRRLLREAWSYWPHLAAIFLLSLLSSPLALLTPLPMKVVVDSVIGAHPLPGFLDRLLPAAARSGQALLALMAGLLVAVALLSELKELVLAVLRAYTGERLVLAFRSRLFSHVQRLSLSYHDSKGTAESIYRIQYDSQAVRDIMIDVLLPLITAGCALVLMLYVIFRLDPELAMVGLAISPVLFVLMRIYRRRLRGQWRAVKTFESSALKVVHEVLGGIRVVKAFGQEDREQKRYVRHSHASRRARQRLALVENGFGLFVALTIAGGTAAVLLIGARHVLSGTLTLGTLLMAMVYLSQLYDPLKTISKKVAGLQSHLAGAERAFAILDHPTEVEELPGARPLVRAAGAVRFRNVSFAYDGGPPVLHGVSFDVEPGARVGIVGTTGAGKSTLASLLTRFYDPTAGRILLDGVDMREYKLADLRDQFAIVLQEPMLFSTSITENIAYGRPGATNEEIIAAATAAGAHDFIVALPRGYDSQVGERGMQLSGGERQRIALARAFLKNAPILVLDEPTSSVDLGTEAGILEALERLMRGRTAFLISHRLRPLQLCDVRLHIEHGRLVAATSPSSASTGGRRARGVSRVVKADA